MKKEDSDLLAEYDFSGGVRGKYAQRYKERGNVVVLDTRAGEDAYVWAPLIDFSWNGLGRQVTEDTRLRPRSDYLGYEQFAYVLAQEEQDRCREIGHWLHISRPANDRLSASEKINSFLLTLWIVRPTLTHVPFRFEETASGTKVFARHLDRFQWVKGQAKTEIGDKHLNQVGRLLPRLIATYSNGRRLRNALVLTLRGCVARDWQEAFVCYCAAAEAMLTYSREPGLTDRLARSYARIMDRTQPSAKKAQDEFKRLYAIRSDIVHGRSYGRQTSSHNLRELSAFSNLLRRLWGRILQDRDLCDGLDAEDRDRERLFEAL